MLLSSTSRVLRQISMRTYAEASSSMTLDFVVPHRTILSKTPISAVTVPASTGVLGILPSHVPTVEHLDPGFVTVTPLSGDTKNFFVSSGFASVHPDNTLTINAVEAYEAADFDVERTRSNLNSVKEILNSSASEEQKAQAEIERDIYEAVLSHKGS